MTATAWVAPVATVVVLVLLPFVPGVIHALIHRPTDHEGES
jgi:uncharacterized membrane protein YqaE (UPF0057 family)